MSFVDFNSSFYYDKFCKYMRPSGGFFSWVTTRALLLGSKVGYWNPPPDEALRTSSALSAPDWVIPTCSPPTKNPGESSRTSVISSNPGSNVFDPFPLMNWCQALVYSFFDCCSLPQPCHSPAPST